MQSFINEIGLKMLRTCKPTDPQTDRVNYRKRYKLKDFDVVLYGIYGVDLRHILIYSKHPGCTYLDGTIALMCAWKKYKKKQERERKRAKEKNK